MHQNKEKKKMANVSHKLFFLMAEIKNQKFFRKNSYPRKICLRSSKALLVMDIITFSQVFQCAILHLFFSPMSS